MSEECWGTSDRASEEELDALLREEPHAIMARARALAAAAPELRASPCVINQNCLTSPLCRHCKWRSMKNDKPGRFGRQTPEAVAEHARWLAERGAQRMFLASGWMGYQLPEHYYALVESAKKAAPLEIYGLFGALDGPTLQRLRDAGMDGYLCGLESPDDRVYRSFRPGGDTLASRLQALQDARQAGLKLWTGFLFGLGENEAQIRRALLYFRWLRPESLSILPFEPFPETEMENVDPPNLFAWARVVAVAKVFLGDLNVFVSQGSHNMVSFGRMAGANAYYYFPGK